MSTTTTGGEMLQIPQHKFSTKDDLSPATTAPSEGEITTTYGRRDPSLSPQSIPKKIHQVEYAVRGKVLTRALDMQKSMELYPFDKLTPCHIGNPHSVGMPALTYIREVLSLVAMPRLEKIPVESLTNIYSEDSIARALCYRNHLTEPGAYTHSQGAVGLREEIAGFLERRDGVRPDISTIFMTNGASDAINTILECTIGDRSDGCMLPMPQYPLYAATVTKLDGQIVFYPLCEESGWNLDMQDFVAAYEEAKSRGVDIKIAAMISPGNPAPTLLTESHIDAVLKFCEEHRVCVLADEVYQDNIYDDSKFCSFRSVLLRKGYKTQLVTLHSSSKGLAGECGFRGGFMQLENVDAETLAILYKMRSVGLCSNTLGQVVMALVTNPPKPGEASYPLYHKERTSVFNELKEKAKLVHQFFNSLEGVSCQLIRGALYSFPRIDFSRKALQAAHDQNISVELMYCLALLEATGIVSTPGDGFGQKENTHHLRMTFLPKLPDLEKALDRYRSFHANFWAQYRD